jgi:hypothetical protein
MERAEYPADWATQHITLISLVRHVKNIKIHAKPGLYYLGHDGTPPWEERFKFIAGQFRHVQDCIIMSLLNTPYVPLRR